MYGRRVSIRSGAVCAASWSTLAGAGAVTAFAAWFFMMFALSPFLSFYALPAAPYAAMALGLSVLLCTAQRPCAAPEWLQRYASGFWLGAFSFLLFVCIVTP